MAFMQVELFSQALHMAVGVDLILPQPVKNEIGMESGEKTDKKYHMRHLPGSNVYVCFCGKRERSDLHNSSLQIAVGNNKHPFRWKQYKISVVRKAVRGYFIGQHLFVIRKHFFVIGKQHRHIDLGTRFKFFIRKGNAESHKSGESGKWCSPA